LTGTIDDLDRKTFSVNKDFRTISEILLSRSFLKTWLLEHRQRGTILEVYTSYTDNWQVRLVLGPTLEPNKCVLATVAFEKKRYTISKSTDVSDLRDDMIRRIEAIIGKENLESVGVDDEVSHMALKSALKFTEPKAIITRAELGEIPSFYRNILILMGTISVVLAALFGFRVIPLDLFVTAIIMVIIALVIELGPRLREVLDSKK